MGAQIDVNLLEDSWRVGETKLIFKSKITRLEGVNDFGVTNIGYTSLEELKANVIKRADQEMWQKERTEKTLNSFSKFSAGGEIHIFLKRASIGSANTNAFTIIIHDTLGVELMRKELEANTPNVPSGDRYWWNSDLLSVAEKLPSVFIVYVIDKYGAEGNKKFKFKVTA